MNVLSFIFIISKHRFASLRWGRGLRLRLAFFQFIVNFPEKIVLFGKFLFDKFVFFLEIDERFIEKFNIVFFRFLSFCFGNFRIGDNKFIVRDCWGFIFAPAGRFAGDGAG